MVIGLVFSRVATCDGTRLIAISRVLREQRRTDGPTDRPTEWLIESRARD